MWNTQEIISAIEDQLLRVDADFRQQQSHCGLDSLRETQLHPFVAQAFTHSPTSCQQEVHFPSQPQRSSKDSERERCDIVLLPEGKKIIYDPVHADRELCALQDTLFAHTATIRKPGPDECLAQDAFWIEIKVIGQYQYVCGVPSSNGRYAHELLTLPRIDIIKLASEPRIRYASVLVVLFTELQESGIHDLSIAMREMIDQDLPVNMPEIRSLPIENYAGNEWCTLGLIPLRL